MKRDLVEVTQRDDGRWVIVVNDRLGITQTPVKNVCGDVVTYGRREDAEVMTEYWLHQGFYGETWGELAQRLREAGR